MPKSSQNQTDQLFIEARQAISQGRPRAAIEYAQKAISIDHRQSRLWHLLADAISISKGPAAGITILESALQDHQDIPNADRASLQIHLASSYLKTSDLGSAATSIDLDLVTALDDPKLAARAGYLLALCEEHSGALRAFECALAKDKENPELLFNAAAAHRSMGNLKAAEKLYDQVIKRAPDSYPAYWLRSSLRKQTPGNNHIAALQRELAKDSTSVEGRTHLNFALAKEQEDLGNYNESFAALSSGARLRKSESQYNVEGDIQAIDTIRRSYSAELLSQAPGEENRAGEGIIFILGMPRTGSTLVDRILSSDGAVDSAGEPDTFAQLFYRDAMQAAGIRILNAETQLKAIEKSTEIDFAKLGINYQEMLSRRAKHKKSQYIIDKNPSNFLYLGAIKLALPGAKIIHIQRNPMDTCYAIFKTLFKSAHPYSYDLADLAEYYSAYDSLMKHWRSTIGNGFLEVRYEDLVQAPEATSRVLMEYCGLEWRESCLQFHSNKEKGTATASAAQVRRPIYADSVQLWERYASQLEPLKVILERKGLL
ncbi:tetratricopeptide repeat-containing sulfotransferase family protein [Microbulbifer sediminum]|uniref:tetratricopeptide repeat-containing sulfotransferase family protein n=1 Tax=Microbulbifer sediminum TaxID=2904250 RepID=UPI001F472117|nr:sulfotransferase [Microbulbifer sediminum]